MKRIMKYLTIIILSLGIVFSILVPAKADSGWDASYDSGGSWDSGSDYSSSDWSDYSSSSSYGSGVSSNPISIILMLIFLIIIISSKKPNYYKLKKSTTPMKKTNYKLYNEITEEVFKTSISEISMEQMRTKIFHIYESIQYAWSNFDYETLKKYTTDELYNMYIAQLHTLKIKAQQNVIKEILKEEIKIIDIKVENNIINVQAYVKVLCYDYVINTKNNKVLRGTDKRKLELEYIIDFVKDNNSNTKINCPNCGNEVNIISSQKCQYCDSVLVQNASDFVMSKKTMTGQRTIMK